MTWSDFYLICFLVGFLLSVMSFFLGQFNLHLPGLGDGGHADLGHADLGHADFGHADTGHFGHADAHGDFSQAEVEHAGARAVPAHGAHFSFFNFGSFAAFLTWFGGAGFLLTRYSSVWFWFGMLIAIAIGLIGASIVFWFVGKVLMAHEQDLDPADYDMVGVLGRISSSIRAGGTGEIIYSQEGTRHTTGARSEDGSPIEKGTEVVVTRYERGIAWVRRWEELAGASAEVGKAE